jgi:YggT family protein
MTTIAAFTRDDVADYVSALVFVYMILIILNIALSWIQMFRPIPYNLTVRAVTGFITESTDPYLAVFRRWIPSFGPLDLSPILAILTLTILGRIVVSIISG